MATCSYCQQRKGKRSCPALGGMICTPCCGQHRLQEIDCPSDCTHLGGLSIVRDPAKATAGFTKAEYETTWEKLHAYARGSRAFRNAALARCFDAVSEPDSWEMDLATGYVYYGHRDADGRRLVDHFLTARGRGLSPGEAAAVMALQRAWASLFEVVSVQTGIGLELRDLVSGEIVAVREVSASAQLKKWDVLFMWLMPVSDQVELTGAAGLVPRQHLDRVREALDAELPDARRARPGVPDRELVGSIAWVAIRELRDAFRDVKMPVLQTTDGEQLVLCKAHYVANDEAAVRARLAGVAELELDDSAYRWLNRAGNPMMGPGSVTLGHIRLSDGELVLETMSRERHERGKRLLEGALGELIAHRADSMQAPEAALRDHRERGDRQRPEPDDVPDDVERELVGQYLQEHYRRWLDAPLPALGGQTPRKAARTDRGRTQVDALLKDIENSSLAMPGGEAVDFAALRRELALDPSDEPFALHYTAETAPDPAGWLALDDTVKAQAVEQHHRSLAAHPNMPNVHLHALMHVIVENQLAGGDPPEVQETLERFSRAGLTRHEAIHAVGSVMAEAILNITTNKTAFDREAAVRALARLQPDVWRSALPR